MGTLGKATIDVLSARVIAPVPDALIVLGDAPYVRVVSTSTLMG